MWGAVVVWGAIALAGCGSALHRGTREPSGSFQVAVVNASFPASQRLSQHSHMVIAVRNASGTTIPNIAVTVCNVSCNYPSPPGQGSSAQAFGADIAGTGLGNSSRPIWIIDRPPGSCAANCATGGPGSGVTAYANTWALGPLAPGQVKRFVWSLTAVSPGRHVVAWEVGAGLNGKTRAVLANGATPGGTFAVTIHAAPAGSYVTDSGRIVTTP